jgi:nucleotide-binding universal stress UspA family protein
MVGVDGSPPSMTALRWAIRQAKLTGSEVDLLVVGSRGHGGFTGALLGSVSQHCVHHAPCPVLVIRTPAGQHGEPLPPP